VAYGFFPHRHQTLFETWPLIHSNDERIDVRDLAYATEFFATLPRRLLS
jgi:acetylornithine deacetylase/succinyl-diaminopimelate desuccinylase-like protein